MTHAAAAANAASSMPVSWLVLAACAAVASPTLLAFNLSPSPTFLNQALALAGFGIWLVAVGGSIPGAAARGAAPLLGAIALLMAAAGVSWGFGPWPSTLALSALGLMLVAALVVLCAAASRRGPAPGAAAFRAFVAAWVAAGLLNVGIATVQVFAPGWTDGNWLATSGIVGRAVGNLRQPNHLSSVFTLAAVALVAWVAWRPSAPAFARARPPRHAFGLALLLLAAFVFGIVLTASRTGLVSVLLLALWGGLDRRLGRAARALLLAAPLLYAAAWGAMALWAQIGQHTFGGAARLAETDITSSRVGIWLNTLALIAREPWTGVGFGQFNLAWSLTPFPGRPNAFFDHTHNLPLQLVVELGLPLALVVLGLLAWALLRAAANAWRSASGDATQALTEAQVQARVATMMVVMAGLHSLLEYPLWYAYFLLPTAWAWGWVLGEPDRGPISADGESGGAVALVGLVLIVAALASSWDYFRVVRIFSAPPGAPPLSERIAEGRRSWFFGHHADYAAVTSGMLAGPAAAPAYARATQYLMDTRITIAWARWLQTQGRHDEARHLALRLREFRRPESAALFEGCPQPRPAAQAGLPADAFACEAPGRVVPWREFIAPQGASGR
jgi:O-antigen ligase